MASKKQLAELIIRRTDAFGDISSNSQLDEREVILLIEQVATNILRTDYFQQLGMGERTINTELLVSFYDVEVKHDAKRDLDYAILPSKFLRLPGDMGIYQISPMKDETSSFIPQVNGSKALRRRSVAKNLEGNIGYWPENDRVYFSKKIKKHCYELLVKLVYPVGNFDRDDLPVPHDIETQIITQVMGLLQQRGVQDKVNDNNNQR